MDRTDFAGRHHARARVGAGGRISDLGQPGADAAGRADRDRRAGRAGAVPHRPGAGRRDRRTRAAAADRRVESRAVSAQLRRGRGDHAAVGDRRRRGRAGRADARTQAASGLRTAPARPTGRVVDAGDKVRGAARQPVVSASAAVARARRSSRRITAGSRTRGCGRCAIWSTCGRSFAARTGQPTRRSTRGSRRPSTRSCRRPTRRCSSRTTISRWSPRGSANGGPRRGPRCSGTSRGPIRIGCGSVHGGARSSTGLLANDLVAFQLERDRRNFVLAVEDELGAEIELDGAARPVRRPRHHRHGRADRRRLRSDSGCRAAIPRSRSSSSGCARRSACGAASSASVSIGWTTPRAFPSGSKRWIACSRAVPSCAGELTFVQIGVPSRSDLDSYSAIESEIDQKVAELNARHGVPGLPPPDLLPQSGAQAAQPGRALPPRALLHRQLAARRHESGRQGVRGGARRRGRRAGAERAGGRGAGVAQALIINPYDVDAFADALIRALDMPREERARACGRCGASWPGAMSSAGRRISSRVGEPVDEAAAVCRARAGRRPRVVRPLKTSRRTRQPPRSRRLRRRSARQARHGAFAEPRRRRSTPPAHRTWSPTIHTSSPRSAR